MPHTRTPPSTVVDLLATATPDPEWTTVLKHSPLPAGADYELDDIKQLSALGLPRLKATLAASRPADVTEIELEITLPSTKLKPESCKNRVLIAYPSITPSTEATSAQNRSFPIIVLFHGGGHTVGTPESELPLARQLVLQHNAIVVLPSYRLAPEHPFPASFNDCFETLKQVSSDAAFYSTTLPDSSPKIMHPSILPEELAGHVSPDHLILGGTSAGATIAASLSHLYRDWRSCLPQDPSMPRPITGILFSCGSCINPHQIPSAYKDLYLARKQNENALPLDKDLYAVFHNAFKPDFGDPLWSSLDQHPELKRERVGEDHEYLEEQGTRVYFQVCGQDMSRDDGLIYEKVLRGETGVQTRLDLYAGFGHVFWGLPGPYMQLEMSKRRMRDSVEGVGWLLRRSE